MTHPDKALADRILAGDRGAVEAFFDTCFPGLFRFAMARVDNDADQAEEIAQATLCHALSALHTYRGEAALFTWLCTLCRHEISAHYKRRKRWPRQLELAEDEPEARAALDSLWAAAVEGPEAEADRSEMARLVHVALDGLPDRYGDVLEWKYLDGLPVDGIAQRLGATPKAAESLLTRARVAFREGFSALLRGRAQLKRVTDER